MIELIFILAILLYSARAILFYIGAYLERKSSNIKDENLQLPYISVVVPARNEENNIEKCINSLLKSNYPTDLFEIIIVNDRSEDKTQNIVENLSQKNKNIKLINVTQTREHKNLKGKAGALDIGIRAATAEYVLMTDADCIVNKNWMKNIALTFIQNNSDFIASYTLIRKSQSIFEHLQEIEWLFMHTMASGGLGLNQPLGCFGNNTAIKKDAYLKVGGYENINFSVTEDLALLQTLTKNNFKANYICNPKATVKTEPVQTIKEYIIQHHRWTVGGKGLGWRASVFVATSISIWLGILLSLVYSHYYWLIPLLSTRIIGDILVIYPVLNRLNLNHLKLSIVPSILMVFILELLTPLYLLKKDVVWKGQIFK